MSQRSKRGTRRRGRPAPRSLSARIASGVAGALIGGAAGRALRPAARRVSRRLGVPAESMILVIEITAPVLLSMAAGRMAECTARRRGPHTTAEPRPDRLVPRGPRSAASRN
ncbi:hypothetical protein [Thermomonospora umbrina]|uniref:hypothetical protein n=1 Tax=Thermomonospora umbrina TaxID=111806 RepID=UPI0011C12588|nr:hypothetical protein [Thermomonospora umbrina]